MGSSRIIKKIGIMSDGEDSMKYRLGTLQDLDLICALIKDAIAEMEKHGIYQWDGL